MIVFVFGSNLKGNHGAGAAKYAADYKGAVEGIGEGRQGMAYAIPTKDRRIQKMRLEDIKPGIDRFLRYAKDHPKEYFLVTRIGCGYAGHTDAEMAPLFDPCPTNCILPVQWAAYLEGNHPLLHDEGKLL